MRARYRSGEIGDGTLGVVADQAGTGTDCNSKLSDVGHRNITHGHNACVIRRLNPRNAASTASHSPSSAPPPPPLLSPPPDELDEELDDEPDTASERICNVALSFAALVSFAPRTLRLLVNVPVELS